MNAHTPGPWYVRGCDGNPGYTTGRHVYSPNEGNTGCVSVVTGSLANARLIAAAPDLLAALEACVAAGDALQAGKRGGEVMGQVGIATDAARAAIAKARGAA